MARIIPQTDSSITSAKTHGGQIFCILITLLLRIKIFHALESVGI